MSFLVTYASNQAEGSGTDGTPFVFTVTRSSDDTTPYYYSVYATLLATNRADFQDPNSQQLYANNVAGLPLQFDANGVATVTILIANDRLVEGDEPMTFYVGISNGTQFYQSASYDVTIVNDDHAPTAASATVNYTEDTATAVTLQASDPDAGDTLTYQILTNPAHGTLSGSNGNYTYTPEANYNGTDSFTY